MAKNETAGNSLRGYTSARVFDDVRALKGAAARCQVERVASANGSMLGHGTGKSAKAAAPALRNARALVKSD